MDQLLTHQWQRLLEIQVLQMELIGRRDGDPQAEGSVEARQRLECYGATRAPICESAIPSYLPSHMGFGRTNNVLGLQRRRRQAGRQISCPSGKTSATLTVSPSTQESSRANYQPSLRPFDSSTSSGTGIACRAATKCRLDRAGTFLGSL
jgi:hypothetical protein